MNRRCALTWKIGLVAAAVVMAVVLTHAWLQSPEIADVAIDPGLPPSAALLEPTSYWPDSRHVVCCISCGFHRRSVVYDIKSRDLWHCPELETDGIGRLPVSHTAALLLETFPWDYIGLSADRKQFFVCYEGLWGVACAPDISRYSKAESLRLESYYNGSVPGGAQVYTSPFEIAPRTPANIPVCDRFEYNVDHDLVSLSPDGQESAMIMPDNSQDPLRFLNHFQTLQSLLIRWHAIQYRTYYALVICDSGGKPLRRIALPGEPNEWMTSYDVRWAPDGRHISCLMDYANDVLQTGRRYHVHLAVVVVGNTAAEWIEMKHGSLAHGNI